MYSTSINDFEMVGENIGEKTGSWFSWSSKPETTRQSWFTFDVKHKLDDKAADLMESSLQELTRLRSMFETTLLKYDYLVEVVDKVICILITVYNMYHQETMGMRAMVALQSLVAAGILKVKYVTKTLLMALQKVFSYMDCRFPLPGSELRAEGGEEQDELQMAKEVFRETSRMFVPILEDELQAQAKTIPEPSLHKWAKTLSAVKSISGFFEHFGKLLWKVVQWSYEKVTGHPLLFDTAKDIAQKGIVWMGRAQDLMKMARVPGKMVASVELCNQVILHGDAALVLEQELMDVGVTRINFSAFFTMVGEFRKVVNEAKNFLGTTKSRSEPVLIGLSGPPNCGKSVAEDILINDLYVADYTAEFGSPPSSNQGIRWERDVQSDYAEGYYNQFATTFDDGWQKDDLETRTKVALELIRMINNAPYPLDMAFDRKGSVFFNSKFVILSQNGADIPKVNLEDKNALLRRFDFFAEVMINDEFVDGTGTIRKIRIPPNHPDYGKPFSRDAYKFKLRNLVENTTMEGWLNYTQFFQLIRQRSIEKTQYRKNPADWAFENPLIMKQEDLDKLVENPKLLALKRENPRPDYSKMEIVAQGKMWTRGEITLKDVSDPSKIVKVDGEIEVEEKQTMESTYFQYVDRSKQFVSIVPPVLLSNKPMTDKEADHQRKLREVAQENHLEFLYNYKAELAKKTGSLIDEAKLAVKQMEEAIKSNAEKSMILKVILGTAAVVGAVGTMYWVYKFFFRDEGMEAHKMGNPEYSGVAKNALGRRKLKPVQNPVPANVRFVKVGAHGGEMALSLFMEKTLKPNMGRMCFYPGPGMKPDCCGFLMVEGTKGIVAKHMWYLMGGKDAFVVLQCNRGGEFRFKVSELQRSMDAVNDTSFFILPLGKNEWRKEGIQEFRNIKHHFLTDKEADDANISHTTLFFSQPGEGDLRIESFSTERAQTPVGYGFSHGPGIKCLSTVTYPTGTMPGMCTSPIIVHNTFITTKILAHHVAGGPHSGVGAVLTQGHLTEGFAACEKDTAIANEYWKGTSMSDIVTGNVDPEYSPVMELVEQVEAESQGFREEWVDETKEPMLIYDERHNYRGQLKDKALWVRFPHKSEIVPSLLAGEICEPTTGPAALAKFKHPVTGEEIFPLQKALAKLVKVPGTDFDRELEEECEKIIVQSIPCLVPARLLTWEETIRGVDGWQFTRSMRTDTALGFTGSPKKGKGKSEAVWRDERGQLHFQEGWKEKCIEAETGYKQGLTGFGANTLHLKDERRKLIKVTNGDTRPFIGSFFVHYCNWRRRFCSFFENLAQSRHLMGACIGINPHSTQWQALLMYLQEVGLQAKALEGDASNFDNSGETEYNAGFVRIVNGWYGIHWEGSLEELEEDNRARDAIYREVSGPCAYVIVGKDVIQPEQFFGSGGLNTFGVNCIKTLKNSIYLPSRRAKRVTQVWEGLHNMWQGEKWENEEAATKDLKLLVSLFNQRQEKWSTKKIVEFCASTHGMRMFTPGTVKEWTRCASGGDDIVMTLAEIMEWFTFEMWCEEAKAIGYTYTTSRKDGSMYDTKDLSEVTFLKRRFDTTIIPGLVTAPMELEDLEEILNWQTVKMEKHEAAHELVRCVLFELFHYGKPMFEEKMEKYNKVLVRKGCKPVLLSYVDLMHQFLDESGLYEEPKYSMIAEAVGLQMEIAPWEAQMKVGENEAQGRTFSSQISEIRGEVTRLEHAYAGQPGVEEASQILRERLKDLEEVSNVGVFIPTRERLKMKLQEKQIKKELGKCVDIMKAQGKTGLQDSLRNKFYAVYNFAPIYEYSRMESGIWVAKSTIFGRKWDGAGVNKKEAEECLLEEMLKELKILEGGEIKRDVTLLEKAGREKRTGDESNTKLVKVPEQEFEALIKQLRESDIDSTLKEKFNKLYQMRAQGADWEVERPTVSLQQQRISAACQGESVVWGLIMRFAGPVMNCRLASTCKAIRNAANNPLYWRELFGKMIGLKVGAHPKEHTGLFDEAMISEFKTENFNPTVFWSIEHPWKEMCRYFMERDKVNELCEKFCEEDELKVLPRLKYHLERDYKLATLHAVHENTHWNVTKPLWKSHVLEGRSYMPFRTAFVDEFLPNCIYAEFPERMGGVRRMNHCHFAIVYWGLKMREYLVYQKKRDKSEMVSLGVRWKRDIKAIMKHSMDHWDLSFVDWEAEKWEYALTCCAHGGEKCIKYHQYDVFLSEFKETSSKDWFEVMDQMWKDRMKKLLQAMDGMEVAQKDYERTKDLTTLMMKTGQMLVMATDLNPKFPTVCDKLGYMSDRVLYAHSDNQAKAGVEAVVTEEITDLQAITTLSGIAEPDVIPTGARFQPWKGKENPLQTEKIGSIFEREYQIGGFTWSGSTTAGTIIQTWAFPDALIGFAPNLQEKLSRFHYFKANMTAIDVSISANQFYSGMLMCNWVPFSYSTAKLSNIWTASTCNPVLIPAGEPARIRIEMPWVNNKTYWTDESLGDGLGHMGFFQIMIMHPLSLIGSTNTPSVPVAVWAHFEGADPAGPSLNAHSGSMKDEQKTRSKGGPISSGLNAMADVAVTMFSRTLMDPRLAAGTAAVSMGLKALASAARKAGLSNPISLKSEDPILNHTTSSFANSTGLDAAMTMTLDPAATVSNDRSVFGCSDIVDSYKYLGMLPGLFDTWSFDGTSVSGVVVKTYRIRPSMCATFLDTTVGHKYKTYLTPLATCAYPHKYWRGTIKICMVFNCPQFMRAEVRGSWHPTFAEIPPSFATGAGDFVSRTWQIQGTTIITFSIPYFQEEFFKEVDDPWVTNSANENGAIAISIVNPVIQGNTVGDSTIYVSSWVAGDEDMDFMFPYARVNATGYARTLSNSVVAPSGTKIAQGSGFEHSIVKIFEQDFPSLIPASALTIQRLNGPEVTQSVKQLMTRYCYYGTTSFTSDTSVIFIPAAQIEGTATTTDAPDTPQALFMNWFNYRRGSWNCKFVVNGAFDSAQSVNVPGQMYCSLAHVTTGGTIESSFNGANQHQGIVMQDLAHRGCLEFNVPFFHPRAFIMNTITRAAVSGTRADADRVGIQLIVESIATKTTNCRIYLGVGDDFSMGWPVGCPVLLYVSATLDEKKTGGNRPEDPMSFVRIGGLGDANNVLRPAGADRIHRNIG